MPTEPERGPLPRLSIVIPAYNEGGRIGQTLNAALEVVPTFPWTTELLVVDDGSGDDTRDIVRDRGETSPLPLRLLTEPHRGKGAAVRAGMLAACGRYRLLFDADMAMDFEEIPRFIEEAETGAEIVIGSREVAGAVRVNETGLRHLRGRAFNGFVRAICRVDIRDTQCGYKLFSAPAAVEIFELLTVDGFAFDVEALLIARRRGYRVREIPIHWRHHPVSKVRPIRDVVAMTRQVLCVSWNDLRGKYRRDATGTR